MLWQHQVIFNCTYGGTVRSFWSLHHSASSSIILALAAQFTFIDHAGPCITDRRSTMWDFVPEPPTPTVENNLAVREYHRKKMAEEAKVKKAATDAKEKALEEELHNLEQVLLEHQKNMRSGTPSRTRREA